MLNNSLTLLISNNNTMITVKSQFPHTLCSVDYTTDNDVFGKIALTNKSSIESLNISVSIRCDSCILYCSIIDSCRILQGETIELKSAIHLTPQYYKLDCDRFVDLVISVYNSDNLVHESNETIHVFPYNHWYGESSEQLASFIFMDDAAVEPIIYRSAYYLRQWTGDDKMSGYLYDVPERPKYTFQAITNAMAELSLNQVPVDTLMTAQCIILPSHITERRKCNSLELALFLATCLHKVKLNPLLCITKNTVLVGCWLMKKELSSYVLKDKDDIDSLVDVFIDRITWFHMDQIFCNADYDISYGFVWANDYLSRHIDEIISIVDIKAVRSNGVYTIPLSSTQTDKLPDYKESGISMTEVSKVDYAMSMNKYRDERLKYVSALRSDTVYIEMLNDIYNRYCFDTHSYGDADILKYLSDYPFHTTVLTEDERNSLYEQRNKTIFRLINHLAHPNIKYGKLVKELVGVRRSDSILIINDNTGGLISMIANDCKKMTAFVDDECTRAVYSVWKNFMQYEHISISLFPTSDLDEEYDKVFVVVSHNANPDSVLVLLDDILKGSHNEVIISFSDTFFEHFWRKTDGNYNFMDRYLSRISHIYLIPTGIAERNDGRLLFRIKKIIQGRIEMTNGLLIPRSAILDSFHLVKNEEKLNKIEVATKLVNIKSPEWAIKISEDKNPYNPITWTIPYNSFCYLDDIMSILSPHEEDWAMINDSFISAQSIMMQCEEVSKSYFQDLSSIKTESINEYDNIGTKYYKLTDASIIIYPVGLDAYKWESVDKFASDKHIFNYKILIIDRVSKSNPLVIKDDGDILVFVPRINEKLSIIVDFMKSDLFFAQQMDFFKKKYTNTQLQGYLSQIIVPKYLYDPEEGVVETQNSSSVYELINKYRELPGENTIPFDIMVANVLKVARVLGILNNEKKITNTKALAELLIHLEYVRPGHGGWKAISSYWMESPPEINITDKRDIRDITRDSIRTRIINDFKIYHLKWKIFDNVFCKENGELISSQLLSASFKNSLKGIVGIKIVVDIMKRYNAAISYESIL